MNNRDIKKMICVCIVMVGVCSFRSNIVTRYVEIGERNADYTSIVWLSAVGQVVWQIVIPATTVFCIMCTIFILGVLAVRKFLIKKEG